MVVLNEWIQFKAPIGSAALNTSYPAISLHFSCLVAHALRRLRIAWSRADRVAFRFRGGLRAAGSTFVLNQGAKARALAPAERRAKF
jgi:hypothetical protein